MTISRRRPSRGGPDKLGPWKLESQLDAGGNGDVWQVSREGHGAAALKVLRRVDRVSYHRFRAEVEVLAGNRDVAGIIPVIDYYLPQDTKASAPWYVMPLAIPMKRYLRGKSEAEIIREFIKLADTLGLLHAREISHRDIKPQNILALGGRLCLSDFGLVKYPKKRENVTDGILECDQG